MVTPLVALKRQTMRYLSKHRDRYYYKRKLPKTTKNLVVSLQTDNKSEANFITAIITARIKPLLEDKALNLQEEMKLIQTTVKEYVEEAKNDYGYYAQQREYNYQYTTKKGSERLGSHPKAIKKAIKHLTDSLYSNKKKEIYEQIAIRSNMTEKIEETQTLLSSTNQDRFIDELIKGEIELLHYDKLRNESRVKTPMINPTYIDSNLAEQISLYNQPYPHTIQSTDPKEVRYREKTARELVEIYISKLTVKEPQRIQRNIDMLLDIVDKEYFIDYTHEDMDRFFDYILDLPDRNANRELFKENPFKKVIEIAREKGIKPIAESTLYSKIIQINKFLDTLVDTEYLDRNRLKNKGNLSAKSDTDKRKEYYSSQLNKLFNDSPQYTSKFEDNLKKFPSRVWIPLILLFQGCRVNEIAQLYLEQIAEIEGYHFIKIKVEHDDQQLKNPTSRRTIPIHKTLIELGILDFIQAQRDIGYQRLFPELYHTKDKGYGQAYSKIYNEDKKEWLETETIQKLENKEILLDLHSFRHNFSGSLKGLIEDGILDYLAGHKNSSQSQHRYGKYRPKLKYEEINKCMYENLNLDRLKIKLHKYYL